MNSDNGSLKGRLFGTTIQRRRYLKERIWRRLPFRPALALYPLYFVRLGFLDGRFGLRFCLMHAVFESFVTAKIWEHGVRAHQIAPTYYRRHLSQFT